MPIIKNNWLRQLIGRGVTLFIHRFMRSPVHAAHQEYSMIYSQHDNPGKPNDLLIDLALAAIAEARKTDLSFIAARTTQTYPDPNEFPGEHYRLLTGLITVLRPVTVIEIGTERGISSLAMKAALPVGAKIHTFDIAPYHQMKNPVLLQRDLDDSLIQHVADLTRTETQQQFTRLFEEADFIFMDAAKDGQMERVFLQFFDSLSFKRKPVLMMDDIHNWNMLAIWRAIERPKLDVSSFAHFTGTGLVLL